MTRPSKPRPWPPESPAEPKGPAEGGYVSEFLSEDSDEYKAVRQTGPAPKPVSKAASAPALAAPPAAAPAAPPAPVRGIEPAPVAFRAERRRSIPWGWLVAAIAVAVGATAWPLIQDQRQPPAAAPDATPATAEGSATIISRPDGAEVWINGVQRGVTPLRLSLPVGNHTLELRNGAAKRELTLTVDASTAVREVIDLPTVANAGGIEVTTDVAGARVSVDGVNRGVTPLTVPNIAPGVHTVTMSTGGATVTRTVTVTAGATTNVVASVVPAGAAGGWVTIAAPFEMQVREGGQVVGTTGADRLMLPAGLHELELVADAYGFRTNVSAAVRPGQTVTVPVSVPDGRLSINAVPWADVWIDGRALGATPLANVTVAVGPHEITFRHPALGERRQTVRVVAGAPTRTSVDFTVGR